MAGGVSDSDPYATVEYLVDQYNKRGIAFLEIKEEISFLSLEDHDEKAAQFYADKKEKSFREAFKSKFNGLMIANYRMTQETANKAIADGHADMASFATLYTMNTDLPEKFAKGIRPVGDLNYDFKKEFGTYYYGAGQGAVGYTDLTVYEDAWTKILESQQQSQ